MRIIISQTNNPYFNLATEEYLIKNLKEDVFYIYQNDPCVIIGKNQNPYTEVGLEFIKKNHISLVRRLSGGGAVYQDLGNFNYSFILKNQAKHLYNFKKYSQTIIDSLAKLGLDIEFSGRNDLLLNGAKISGTAQLVSENNLIHHGTLLFDADFSNVKKILLPNNKKLVSKGVKSIQSRVTNIKKYLPPNTTIQDIINTIVNYVGGEISNLTPEETTNISQISQAKKDSISFLLTNNEKFDYLFTEYIPGFGSIEIHLNISQDKISKIKIYGEYFSKKSFEKIEKDMIGISYNYSSLMLFFDKIKNFEDYFHNMSKKQFVQIILQKNKD